MIIIPFGALLFWAFMGILFQLFGSSWKKGVLVGIILSIII